LRAQEPTIYYVSQETSDLGVPDVCWIYHLPFFLVLLLLFLLFFFSRLVSIRCFVLAFLVLLLSLCLFVMIVVFASYRLVALNVADFFVCLSGISRLLFFSSSLLLSLSPLSLLVANAVTFSLKVLHDLPAWFFD
jgi:uncharacterized membrane protein